MAEKTTGATAAREGQQLGRRDMARVTGRPFAILDRFADEVDRVFEDFGVGSGWLAPRWVHNSFGLPLRGTADHWVPAVEIHQRDNEFVVRADLPGTKKEDVKVDITNDALKIQGERRQEQHNEHGGVYRSERSYGKFERVIALPEGAMTEQAKATFKDGVLEITMPAPSEDVTSARRLEITEGTGAKK